MSKYIDKAVQRQAIVLFSLGVNSAAGIYTQGAVHFKASTPITTSAMKITTPTPIRIHLVIVLFIF
tara:strand:+ start:638 stop:835 length:198 start_codon:yes stop_codon:yes gene_type:complete